ncbi:MAG: hypothetical protein P8I93_06500 [Crocinitomicaceae bacterium]|nr:hypothetical protein [Crocinitomicaceae bacterium]
MTYLRIFFFFLFINNLLFCQERLSIEGYFQGKSIYIENPVNSDGFGFCVNKVAVNGDVVPISTRDEVIALNLTILNIKVGSPVLIIIYHEKGCSPVFINPEVLRTKSTFELSEIKIIDNKKLEFKTVKEQGKLPFLIEQYKWDKWVKVGEVQGNGSPSTQSYSYMLSPHSGENKVRVSQIDNTNKKRPSKAITFESNVLEIYKSPTKVKTTISFSSKGIKSKTHFEIFDAYGNVLKQGYSSLVNCTSLVNGLYYINYDNKTEKFIKN